MSGAGEPSSLYTDVERREAKSTRLEDFPGPAGGGLRTRTGYPRRMRRAALITAALAIAAGSSQASHASTIVYGCGYNICGTNPDGSHRRHIPRNGRQLHRYGGPRLTAG